VAVDRVAFDQDGFVVLSGAVPRALCADLVTAIDAELGINATSASWYARPRPFLDLVPLWGHPAQWAIRQVPLLHQAWSELWETSHLLVSLDRCRFSPPWREGEPEPQPLHWDHDPRDPELRYIQGAVALTDTGVGHGGFRCAPGWHRHPERWPAEPTASASGDAWIAAVAESDIVSVPMAAGDVVLWSSRLPHSNSRNEGTRPRYAFYLQMVPYSEPFAAELAACWQSGLCQRAWNTLPGHDHAERWAPVSLTALGRRLAGVDAWGTDTTRRSSKNSDAID
jgi:ectoine hydroxylase-related dioxygenase (phytanoyl-CoA dioxygenase family)